MYISKIVLNPAHRLVRRDIFNRYRMHQTLADVASQHLYRLEQKTGNLHILMQSPAPPNFSNLPYNYALSTESRSWPLDFQTGDMMLFKLAAHPVINRTVKTGSRNNRQPLEPLAWLTHRSQLHGFETLSVNQLTPVDTLQVSKPLDDEKKRRWTISTVTLTGTLRIIDLEKFTTAVTTGVGHSKHLGQGLLSVLPTGE
jgi:CRISPR system Cascade subunit CasE